MTAIVSASRFLCCRFGAALAGSVMMLTLPAAVASAKDKSANISCSFIAKQCVSACSKEAPEPFCKDYCASKRSECLSTGNWIGISRTFMNVKRK